MQIKPESEKDEVPRSGYEAPGRYIETNGGFSGKPLLAEFMETTLSFFVAGYFGGSSHRVEPHIRLKLRQAMMDAADRLGIDLGIFEAALVGRQKAMLPDSGAFEDDLHSPCPHCGGLWIYRPEATIRYRPKLIHFGTCARNGAREIQYDNDTINLSKA